MSNSETAQDNKFMAEAKQDSTSSNNTDNTSLLSSVLSEHLSLYHSLKKVGVNVHLFNHTLEDDTPDAVFPNNWFSTRRSLVMRSQEQSELEKEQNQSPRNEAYKSNREKVNKTMILSDNDSSNFCIEGVDLFSKCFGNLPSIRVSHRFYICALDSSQDGIERIAGICKTDGLPRINKGS